MNSTEGTFKRVMESNKNQGYELYGLDSFKKVP